MAPRKRHIEPAAESKDHGNKFCGLRADASPTDSDQGHWLEYQRRAEQRDKLVKRRAPLCFAFIHKADGMPLERRMLFRLSEIADLHATAPPALSPDPVRRAEILEVLRLAIQRGEFIDAKGRSRIRNLHPSPLSELRFDPHSARDAELFPGLASHLWVSRRDVAAWFNRRKFDVPSALQTAAPAPSVAQESGAILAESCAAQGQPQVAPENPEQSSAPEHAQKPTEQKAWRAKPGERSLSRAETAVLRAVNALWPHGDLEYKAKARDKAIRTWMTDKPSHPASTRVIQRTLKIIHFN
jgi:hypothetical protein